MWINPVVFLHRVRTIDRADSDMALRADALRRQREAVLGHRVNFSEGNIGSHPAAATLLAIASPRSAHPCSLGYAGIEG